MRKKLWSRWSARLLPVGEAPLMVALAAGVVLFGCSISLSDSQAGAAVVHAQGTQGTPSLPTLRTPSLGQPSQSLPPVQRSQLLEPLPTPVRQAQLNGQAPPAGQVSPVQASQGRLEMPGPFAPTQGRLAQNLQGQETQAQPGPTAQSTPEAQRRIVVSGSGEVKAAPNVAHITLGVEGQASTAREALSQVSSKANDVIAALRQLGIQERQIQTAAIDLRPVHETPLPPDPGRPVEERQGPPQVVGYRAVNQIRVRVVNLDQLGGAIDAAVGAGANIASGIQFSVENDSAARQEALRQAVQEARSEATVLAEALGVRITGVRAVVEEEAGSVRPLPEIAYSAVASREADVATPVQPGEVTIRKQVQVIFDIG